MKYLQLFFAILLGSVATSDATAFETQPTLRSGEFGDERLILAADPERGVVSGYFRDGDCRVFFTGPLRPVTQYQRPELGESYDLQSWDPRRPAATFTTTLYSRARGGFNDQITLEPGPDDANRPAACRWRISLDRAAHVSNGLVGAAVVARARPQRFELAQTGEDLRLVPKGRAALPRDSGVWINKTYGAAWFPAGMVRISWYDPPGTPHGGYVRERDLYPMRAAGNPESIGLPCTTLRDGIFEPLGDCAVLQTDDSYTVEAGALRQLRFDRYGLDVIAIRKAGYAYVRRDGHALLVPTFDNAPDDFVDGLVRVRLGDKLGYADRRLRVVIPAIYDGAHQFSKKRAWVCTGCKTVSDGEHSFYRGGQAACLDPRGNKRPAEECGQAGWLPPQLRE
ncbi:WG repeat-containing protein [Sphingorhabdus sp.]|uniref:WG repeat-containing protein n=1 Tax=Sphingorhabdus sp. TaxID=1902408 RepID=UPI0035B1CBF0